MNHEAAWIRITRLFQWYHYYVYMMNLETSPGTNVIAVKLGKCTVAYLLLSHLIGCGW